MGDCTQLPLEWDRTKCEVPEHDETKIIEVP